MRRTLLRLIGAALVAGCGNPTSTTTDDLGVADMAAADAAGGDDLAPFTTGTKAVGGDVALLGATDHDVLIYADNVTGTVSVVRADGTGQQDLEPDGNVGVSHDVVFVWHNTDGNGDGDLAVWAAGAVKEISTGTAVGGLADASADNAYVGWVDGAVSGVGNLEVAKVDGSGLHTLRAGIQTADPCPPQVQFVGARLVASYCLLGDGGAGARTVTSFDPASGNGVDLQADAGGIFAADPTGKNLFVTSSMNGGSIVPVGGGNALATAPGADSGLFTGDGSAVVFHTATGGLGRLAVTGGMPVVLQGAGAQALDQLSPDGKWMLYHSKLDQQTAFTDLLLAPADAAGTAITLESGTDAASGGLYGDPFTADSSHALYFTNIDPDNFFGDYFARATDNGASAMQLSSKVWIGYAGLGATAVYNDNWAASGASDGLADIHAVDVTKPSTATVIATRAGADILVSVDKKKVFFTWAADPKRAGLYSATLP